MCIVRRKERLITPGLDSQCNAICGVLGTKTHSQARDINMYNLFTEHSKPPSYIQSTFLLSASSRDPQNRSSRMSFSR
ncbi:hypothetical protein TNCV_3832751 [Trichonephila clavipes]|nr:hypothetical protein TNCV_3832751 [Trichonephila clavipes]